MLTATIDIHEALVGYTAVFEDELAKVVRGLGLVPEDHLYAGFSGNKAENYHRWLLEYGNIDPQSGAINAFPFNRVNDKVLGPTLMERVSLGLPAYIAVYDKRYFDLSESAAMGTFDYLYPTKRKDALAAVLDVRY